MADTCGEGAHGSNCQDDECACQCHEEMDTRVDILQEELPFAEYCQQKQNEIRSPRILIT